MEYYPVLPLHNSSIYVVTRSERGRYTAKPHVCRLRSFGGHPGCLARDLTAVSCFQRTVLSASATDDGTYFELTVLQFLFGPFIWWWIKSIETMQYSDERGYVLLCLIVFCFTHKNVARGEMAPVQSLTVVFCAAGGIRVFFVIVFFCYRYLTNRPYFACHILKPGITILFESFPISVL